MFTKLNLKLFNNSIVRQCLKHSYYNEISLINEPFYPIPHRFPKWAQNIGDLFSCIKSGDSIFCHGGAATPYKLVNLFLDYTSENNVKDIKLYHIHLEGGLRFAEKEYDGIIRSNSFFTGANCRSAIAEGRADYTPIFLHEIPSLFRKKIINLDAVFLSVTPPDVHGFCSLGPSVDCTRSAIQNAKYIIAQVNPNLPRVYGDSFIHMSHIDCFYYLPQDLPHVKASTVSEEERKIGSLIANNLVDDGATLQMGIGSIPDSVMSELLGHKDLGVHTEMFSDTVIDLVHAGCITNSQKLVNPGKIVSTFVIGTNKTFEFIDKNPLVLLLDVSITNDTSVIRRNPKVTAINSCIEIDLTGQVVSDSIGSKIYSGFGGQVDFIRGASLSSDGKGKAIIAMCSQTGKGQSKITPFLKPNAGVVTTRAHVHYVVTEYGIAYLFGKNLRQRAYELINIAHPDHREHLEASAFERLRCMPSKD